MPAADAGRTRRTNAQQGKANLQEALSYYVQGEQVEWKCEQCGKVVEAALKRLSLKKLPNTLIIHLKRFDFDYATMLRAKLSNLFEFPMDLDMEPYTTEGIAKAEARKKREEDRSGGEQAETQEGTFRSSQIGGVADTASVMTDDPVRCLSQNSTRATRSTTLWSSRVPMTTTSTSSWACSFTQVPDGPPW